jgi:hypothetical protein
MELHSPPPPDPCSLFSVAMMLLFSGLTSPHFVPPGSWIFLGGSNSLILGRKCCRGAVKGAVELKYHLLQWELVGGGEDARKILVISNARIF